MEGSDADSQVAADVGGMSAAGSCAGTSTDQGRAKAAAAKGKARPRPVRPRIDLDEQISQANQLAQVTKKMLHAAKVAQKSQKKQKQRLIRKAGKLSAQDLERIAVLKRCGLYADDEEGTSAASGTSMGSTDPDERPVLGPADKQQKLADVVQKIEGSQVVLEALGHGASHSGSADGKTSGQVGHGAASHGLHPDGRPRGSRLLRALSKTPAQLTSDSAHAANEV